MTILVAGLVLFLGVHSVRVVADDWRSAQIARLGALRWRGLYSLASLVGLVLIVWGYGQARMDPVVLWSPPLWTRYVTSALVLPAFVLFGSILVWAIVVYASARRRDRVAGTVYPPGNLGRDARAVVVGTIVWFVFGYWLHGPLIGVRPF